MQVKIKQRSQKLNSFKEIVKKTVNFKVKAAFRSYSYTCNTNQHCFWDSRSSAVQLSTQGQPIKDLQVEKLKLRSQEQKVSAI